MICQDVGSEAVLLDMATQQYFGLNDTGARMWEMLSRLKDTESVLREMEGRYEVSREVVEADLTDLVGRLEAAGLVRSA